MRPDDLIPDGDHISGEVWQLCEEHEIEFGALYAEARRKLAEASEEKGVTDEELLGYEPGVRRMCRIVVATAAGLSDDGSQLILGLAARLNTFAQEKGSEEMVQHAHGLLDLQLSKSIQ